MEQSGFPEKEGGKSLLAVTWNYLEMTMNKKLCNFRTTKKRMVGMEFIL